MLKIPVQRKSHKTVAQNFKDSLNKGNFISLNEYGEIKLMNTNSSYVSALAKEENMFFLEERTVNASLNEKIPSSYNLNLKEIEDNEAAEVLLKGLPLFALSGENNNYRLNLVDEDEFVSYVANNQMFFRALNVEWNES